LVSQGGCSQEQPLFASEKGIKKGVRIKIQPRFKIQYPMKNRGKDNGNDSIMQEGVFPILLWEKHPKN
jgi:hypothetical protein